MNPNASDRLDLLRARALSRDVARQPWLTIGLPALGAGLVALLLLGRQKLGFPAGSLLGPAAGIGAAMGIGAGRWLATRADDALFGATGPLFCDPARRRGWIVRRGLLLAIFFLAVALVALPLAPALAATLAFSATTGLARLTPSRLERALSSIRTSLRPIIWLSAVALGALASWRGVQDQSETLSMGGVFGAALGGGLVWLRIEPRLFRLLLTTRRSLAGILLSRVRDPLIGGLVGGGGAAVVAQPGILEGFLMVAAAAASLTILTLLRGLTLATRGERTAEAAFSVEAALLALLAMGAGPLAAVWAVARVVWLWRLSRVRRWEAR